MAVIEMLSDEAIKDMLPVVSLGTAAKFLAYRMTILSPYEFAMDAKPSLPHEIHIELHRDDVDRWCNGVTSGVSWWNKAGKSRKRHIQIYVPREEMKLLGMAELREIDRDTGTIEMVAKRLISVALGV